ncbi:MAG: DUF3810 domain-containing protein [Oscillospiraceae bacterium]|nr:DUF3810 domain-containing protein [Oscillospiraceae bacterium]
MKYWTGFLTAGIIGAITWALMRLAEKFEALVDMIYPYLSRNVLDILAKWSSGVNFCLWQMGALVIGLLVIASIVLMIVMKWNPVRWLGWVLTVAATVYFLNTLVFGLNYYAGPLAEDIRLEVRRYDVEELTNATVYYRDKANFLAKQVKRDASGDVAFEDFDVLAKKAGDGFHTLVYKFSYPVFAGSTVPVKELGWSDMYTSMGITGVTMGITGEAAVNPQIPAVSIPFTMCHEMAHRMSIANERDANFAGFLASMANEDIQYQYSAYFMAYRYCYSALLSVNAQAAARVSGEVNAELQHDMDSYTRLFSTRQNKTATKVANTANDTYLRTSGDSSGIGSYGEVTDLLVSWHYQRVVLPSITTTEKKFDPYDETQVDLSGIVNAKDPKPTEPVTDAGGGVG